jgi:hypothetical protein
MTVPPVHWIWVAFKVYKPIVQNLLRKPHMAFVKVVGGIEIYNFCIQSFVHFYTNFWSFSISKSGLAKCSGQGAAAPRPRAPAGLDVSATRRPRPHAGRGVPLPHAPRLEAHWSPPWLRARHGPSVRRRRPSYVRQLRPPCHSRISMVMPSLAWSSRPYLNRAPCLSSPRHHCLPCHPRRRRWTHLYVHPLVRPTIREPPLDPVGPMQAACSPGRALAIARTEAPRSPPPAIVVRPHWQLPRPNFGHPQALGEHVVTPHSLPGRERRRLAAILPAPPPPQAQGPNCKAPCLSRVFSVNQRHSCVVSVFCRVLGPKEHLQ